MGEANPFDAAAAGDFLGGSGHGAIAHASPAPDAAVAAVATQIASAHPGPGGVALSHLMLGMLPQITAIVKGVLASDSSSLPLTGEALTAIVVARLTAMFPVWPASLIVVAIRATLPEVIKMIVLSLKAPGVHTPGEKPVVPIPPAPSPAPFVGPA